MRGERGKTERKFWKTFVTKNFGICFQSFLASLLHSLTLYLPPHLTFSRTPRHYSLLNFPLFNQFLSLFHTFLTGYSLYLTAKSTGLDSTNIKIANLADENTLVKDKMNHIVINYSTQISGRSSFVSVTYAVNGQYLGSTTGSGTILGNKK